MTLHAKKSMKRIRVKLEREHQARLATAGPVMVEPISSVDQLAVYFRTTPGSIFRLIGRGKRALAPSFRQSDIQKFLAANEVRASGDKG